MWKPIKEEKTKILSSESLNLFLEDIIVNKLNVQNKIVNVSISPDSELINEQKQNLKLAVEALHKKNITYNNVYEPIDNESSSVIIWLDIIFPEKVTYWWKDSNQPVLAIMRLGELETAQIRILAIENQHVLLIDEIPFKHLLEHDLMFPSWMSIGGIYLHRVATQVLDRKELHDYSVSVLSTFDEPQMVPEGVKRFFWSTDIISPNIVLYSVPTASETEEIKARGLDKHHNHKQEETEK